MIRIIINGAMGKMGQALCEGVALGAGTGDDELVVVAGIDRYAAGAKGPFPIFESVDQCDVPADVVVDFSRPDALPQVIAYCKDRGLPCVIATTGLDEAHQRIMDEAAEHIPVFQSANMSLGINLMLDLVRTAAMALGARFDVEIVEAHHNSKIDAPSGTAFMLFNSVNEAMGGSMEPVFGRNDRLERRSPNEVGISSIRGGTVTGAHEVMFFGPDEVLTIGHSAQSRRIFALGALGAVRYIVGRQPGRYTMEDLIIEQTAVERLYVERHQAMVTLHDIPQSQGVAPLFSALAAGGVNIDMISQTAPRQDRVDVSFTLAEAALDGVHAALGDQPYDVRGDLVKLAVEGTGMVRQSGVAARVLGLLAEQDASPLLITTSETKIAVCLPAGGEQRAERALKEAFRL